MKFLIVGLGSIGRRHLRNLIALGEHDIILFRTNHSTLDLEEFSSIPVFHDLESALGEGPDGVVISNLTPGCSHSSRQSRMCDSDGKANLSKS
jgi:predicted dehydrogenase